MSMIPKTQKKSLEFINTTVNKKALNRLLSEIYSEFGAAKTAFLANALKDLGFKYATKAGVTISIEDLKVPEIKKELLSAAEEEIEKAMHRYYKGEITEVERYTKVIDTWSDTTASLTSAVVENFDRLNPIYMMAFSGARGNISQVSQLVGMRGLMADAQGQIIDLPIKSNFREGLSVTEYIISSYGARKGLVDTALKTADSGYLTRRLVDVAQDVIIQSEDCQTDKYIELTPIYEGDKEIVHINERLVGRTSFEDIYTDDGELIIAKNELFDRSNVKKIEAYNIKSVKVRSPLTCALDYGICQMCYGWALTNNKLVDVGESIGIIAAQSIGEPGTQLTMRTFHTGGVFRGSSANQQIKTNFNGEVVEVVKTREFRTRHGDIVNTAVREGNLVVKTKDDEKVYHVPYNAVIFVKEGDQVEEGAVIAEFDPTAARGDAGRLTEKAQKDIQADISGQILFEGFVADEKRDRQGNISRTATRGGIIWILAGDVYNLPAGATLRVENGDEVTNGDILAETVTVSEHGGEVRVNPDMETELIEEDGEDINVINVGKELTVVIASIKPENALLETTKKEQMWICEEEEETYIIKSPAGTVVENGMIIAELIDDKYSVQSSGEIRYEDIEVDERRIVTHPGKVLFIPEEVHQISKDVALQLVDSGTFVEAGTEVVKDLKTHIDGIVDIVVDNDIIHEVIVRPGELYRVDDIAKIEVEDGEIVEAGTNVAPGIVAQDKRLISITIKHDVEDDELVLEDDDDDENVDVSGKYAEVLLRPVQEYFIEPQNVAIKFNSTEPEDNMISIVPVTQLQYRDGDRVRQLTGATLTRTSLVLQMHGYLSHLKGMVELDPKEASEEEQNLKIVVLENLIVRREVVDPTRVTTATRTQLLVKDGDFIEPKTAVAKTQVLAEHTGKISFNLSEEETRGLRKLLIMSSQHITRMLTDGQKAIVNAGDLIRLDQPVTEENKIADISGQVVKIEKDGIVLRKGRPYLISQGTQLQINTGDLVLRGDLIATLIFERQKTGDIVQGLPRVEELLEARKPKESAILAEDEGVAEIEYDEDIARLFIVNDSGRKEIKIPLGSNIIVSDKQSIIKGQPLTDGPLNPHDVLRLRDVEAVQQYLVDEVQRVYRSQGVDIADKHIEVIVRRMTKKVRVDDSGGTQMLPGELVENYVIDQENVKLEELGGQPAQYHPVLLGITKASLKTDSFISAASFQETTRILTEAAVEGKKDLLRGLKENVIIGRLIPAGTGFYHLNFAGDKTPEVIEEKTPKTSSRKPSAILEEIEGMFGSPDFTIE